MNKKEKINEIIRYLIIGVLTTIVSLAIYYGLVNTVLNPNNPTELQIANILSWIGSVIFAYITNRKYVFKSSNQNKLKEATSFVGSRVMTLLMDMGIMFLGVTYLKQNDKIVKLISQIIVIVSNYLLSKLLVFKEEKKRKSEKKNHKWFYLFYCLPFLDLLSYIFQNNNIIGYLQIVYKTVILLILIKGIYQHKKNVLITSGLLFYVMIQLIYFYCRNIDLLQGYNYLIQIIMLPLAIMYFQANKTKEITQTHLYRLFVLYLFVFLLPITFNINRNYNMKNGVMAILLCMLPMMINILYEHKNYLLKIFLFLLIILAIILWQSKVLAIGLILSILILFIKKHRNWRLIIISLLLATGTCIYTMKPTFTLIENKQYIETVLDDRIIISQENYEIFKNANLEEQIFGLYKIPDLNIKQNKIDLCDIFFTLGYFGFAIYTLILLVCLWKFRTSFNYILGLLLVLGMSVTSGNVLINSSLGLILGMFITVSNKKQSNVLIVSNMYPSKKYKHYGSFVKNCKDLLEELNFHVDLSVMKKHDNILIKALSYIFFYMKTIFISIFNSYDYYYVHFVSHSTYPVLLGKITGKTKLICNVHGNDIVPDYEFEEKNVKRSKFVLKFADKIISPSIYFKDVLINKYHFTNDKIIIFPSGGINQKIFKKLDRNKCLEELQLNNQYNYYGMVARIEKDKGWDTLLKAVNELKKKKKLNNIKILIIGTGQEQPLFTKMMKEYKLEDSIQQVEFVTQQDLVKYYNCMDLFILPTKRKSESLSLVGLEAMASGTFVIGCDLYGPREYLQNGINSLTFQNEKELSNKIIEFQEMNNHEKNKIKQNAFKTVQNYDITKMKEKLLMIFQNIE